MPEIAYARETAGRLEPFDQHEWLLTNGLGGFAMGTVADVPTRRYHGLLVAATVPPVGRIVALSRYLQLLMIDGRRVDFSAARFDSGEGPRLLGEGVSSLRRFALEGEVATWTYDVEGTTIVREVLVCWERNACAVRYTVRRGAAHAGGRLSLQVAPFVALRDFHGLLREGQGSFTVDARERGVTTTSGETSLHIEAGAGRFEPALDWWRGFHYAVEADRGLDHTEDLFTPGRFILDVAPSDADAGITLWAGLGELPTPDWESHRHERIARMAVPAMPTATQARLARAAADFVVSRPQPDGAAGSSVIAGYPWFADWGRDTFISMTGLFLVTGRREQARQVLSTFAEYVSEGMIPNRFNDYTNHPEYNTVDASLWFIHAAHEYASRTRDNATYERVLRPACREIIDGYTRGTRYGIRVDPADGLVTAGDETTQLTWMDARRDGIVFTPRHGKAVEINALWYNALMLLGETGRAEQVRRSFCEAFVDPAGNGLFDVVGPAGPDRAIRPNQVFAVSLPHSPLSREQQLGVVEAVRRELLTPVGLRTLSPRDPKYHPRFEGPIFERDRAYHNGTVWPWLIGGFLDAWLRVHDRSPAAVEQARRWLQPLIDHLGDDGCLGSIAEVFDAAPPHRPAGCCAQAWSVAEALRLAVELGM